MTSITTNPDLHGPGGGGNRGDSCDSTPTGTGRRLSTFSEEKEEEEHVEEEKDIIVGQQSGGIAVTTFITAAPDERAPLGNG